MLALAYLEDMNEQTFFIKPTDKFEVLQIINSFNLRKASGHNSFPNKILYLMKLELSASVAEIVNLSFETGTYYIDKLKISEVMQRHWKETRFLQLHISQFLYYQIIVEKIIHSRL